MDHCTDAPGPGPRSSNGSGVAAGHRAKAAVTERRVAEARPEPHGPRATKARPARNRPRSTRARPTGETRSTNGRFRGDDRAQLLILTGVLLVLGFVTIGATLVQVQTLDEATARQSRDNLLDSFDELVNKFDQTLVDGTLLGETDVVTFQDFAARAEAQMRDTATKRGIFLTVEPDTDPDEGFYQRVDRCYAYKSEVNGVISSFERNSRDESIVGAVYDIYASDGTQTVSAKYYVKIHDCLLSTSYTYTDSVEAHYGTVQRFDNATQVGDDPRAMTAKEEYVQMSLTTSYLDPDPTSITSQGAWDQTTDMKADDDLKADYEGAVEEDDYLRWHYVPSEIHVDATIASVTARVDSWQSADVEDDTMYLQATLGSETSGPYAVENLLVETTNLFTIPHPSGNTTWTRAELADTVFQVHIDSGLLTEPSEHYLEYVNLTTVWYLEYYDLQVDFEFDRIPDLFHEHHLEVSYRMPETNTTGERFHFQAYDATRPDGSEWRTVHTIDYTVGGWVDFRDQLIDAEYPQAGNQRPLFRVVDSDSTDKVRLDDADLDYIEFDYVRIESVYTD